MSVVETHAPGTFCWVELGTTDTAAAKRFYTGLFGWSVNDVPMGDDAFYSMLRLNDRDVGALYQQDEEQRAGGMPPHWMVYVSVANADESAAKAKSLGATVLKQPFDVMEVGRMAVLCDPAGTIFSLWEPKLHAGAGVAGEPGSMCWHELQTTDAGTAGAFYASLFDWRPAIQQMGGGVEYTLFRRDGPDAGGMIQMTEEWGGTPPNWLTYFAVDDCDRAVDRAKQLGARIHVPPTDIPSVGRFAVIADPQGAVFAILKPDAPA